MSLLQKAQEHYKAKLDAEPRALEVPEWGATVYIKPAISLLRLGEVMELANSGKAAEAMVLTLIYRLVDEEGTPLFRKAERTELMRSVDPDVLARIVSVINEDTPTEDDALGN